MSSKSLKFLFKLLHEVSTAGIMGAIATQLILAAVGVTVGDTGHAAIRLGILRVSQWLLLPSLMVVLFTGFMAMAVHPPFHNRGWAWFKVLLGFPIFEGTLNALQSTAQNAAELSAKLAAGNEAARAPLLGVVSFEHKGGLLMLFLCVVNVLLAVYRPRFTRLRRAST